MGNIGAGRAPIPPWHRRFRACMATAWSSTGPTAAPPYAVVTAVTMPGRAMSEDDADQL